MNYSTECSRCGEEYPFTQMAFWKGNPYCRGYRETCWREVRPSWREEIDTWIKVKSVLDKDIKIKVKDYYSYHYGLSNKFTLVILAEVPENATRWIEERGDAIMKTSSKGISNSLSDKLPEEYFVIKDGNYYRLKKEGSE